MIPCTTASSAAAGCAGNQDTAFSVNQRLLVLCGEQSRARVIEHFASARGQQETFTNGVTELLLQRGMGCLHRALLGLRQLQDVLLVFLQRLGLSRQRATFLFPLLQIGPKQCDGPGLLSVSPLEPRDRFCS